MWCRDLTECLTADENVLEAVKGAEERCFQVCTGLNYNIFYPTLYSFHRSLAMRRPRIPLLMLLAVRVFFLY